MKTQERRAGCYEMVLMERAQSNCVRFVFIILGGLYNLELILRFLQILKWKLTCFDEWLMRLVIALV